VSNGRVSDADRIESGLMRLFDSADPLATRPLDRVLVVLVLSLLASLLLPTAPHARADAGLESQFVAATNQARAAQGLPALAVAGDLTSAARAHSRVMADSGDLHHDPNLSSTLGDWRKFGDNVGNGASVSSVHARFMGSSQHRRNILDPDFTQVGIGVVVDGNGQIWVTQVFRQPAGASPAPAPDPAPAPAPTPDPAPAPAPTPDPAPAPAPAPAPSVAPAPAPPPPTGAPEPEPAPEPETEPYAVATPPVALDRMTLLLARQVATETGQPLDEILDVPRAS
jgi:uncharacterized protein YkwD